MSVDVSHLSPSDAVVALRSYPRRFRGLLEAFDDDEKPEDLVRRPGPDGRSGLDHADHAARAVAAYAAALHEVLVSDRPTVQVEVPYVSASNKTAEAAVDFLMVECEALATAVDRVDAGAWARKGTYASTGREVTALDLVREAVRVGSDDLRAAEAAIDAARHAGA